MIKCLDIERNLIDLLDGSIQGDRRMALLAHLDDCPECRKLLATSQTLFDRLNGQLNEVPPQDLWFKLQAKIVRMEDSRPSRLRLPVQWRPVLSLSLRSIGLAAAVAVGIYLGKSPLDAQKLADVQIAESYASSMVQTTSSPLSEAMYQIETTGDNGL